MTDQIDTFTYKDTEYSIADLTDRQKYLLGQIQDLQHNRKKILANLDQVDVALEGFTQRLDTELAGEPEE